MSSGAGAGPPVIPAYAKVNLTLAVGARRPDGYHAIESLMQSIALADRVRLRPRPAGIEVACRSDLVPKDERNTAWRAAAALAEAAGVQAGALIEIDKEIPVAAGLGGGSADAAAVLRGLNRLWGLDWPLQRLQAVGGRVGADVPFCLVGGTAIARGIGEELTPVRGAAALWLVLANPGAPLATRDVYAAFDEPPAAPRPLSSHPGGAPAAGGRPGEFDTPLALASLMQPDRHPLGHGMGNALEPAARRLCPAIDAVVASLWAAGARKVFVTGSGPTVVGLVGGEGEAHAVAARMRGAAAWVWAGTTLPGAAEEPP